ncbi:hypothetical protein J6590_015345 [Homalodisca vitripennis]|nr:hypothetical protein J6590_015345 [Homalodisca vitripennis]
MALMFTVSEIQCTFSGEEARRQGKLLQVRDSITAKLRKPEGFKGSPLFADDRGIDPLLDAECQIKPDPEDLTGLAYTLLVTNFGRCGVLKRNGFVHVRVWFPQFPGVVMMSDQELIIMCKPPEPTIIENKAAGFAGSFPHGARVSGVVEETPGRLEYEVALYKEAPARKANSSSELPVDQAVPIGTKLQLRARINPQSVCVVFQGFVHVRVWFPQFPGVVMMSDQELIIMCKPPEPTIIENKAAGFAGSFPHGARVSGVVEETPGRLEYEVALYKEAPARKANSSSELPVDQAVPIGTKLQLRARINPQSVLHGIRQEEGDGRVILVRACAAAPLNNKAIPTPPPSFSPPFLHRATAPVITSVLTS